MIAREIHKILIPVDDSKMSDRAFDYGMDMAKLFDAEVHVIYVANGEGMSTPDFTVHFNEKNDDTSPLKEKGAAVLARLMKRVPEGGEGASGNPPGFAGGDDRPHCRG